MTDLAAFFINVSSKALDAHIDYTALLGEWGVSAHMWTADPGSRRIAPVFIVIELILGPSAERLFQPEVPMPGSVGKTVSVPLEMWFFLTQGLSGSTGWGFGRDPCGRPSFNAEMTGD